MSDSHKTPNKWFAQLKANDQSLKNYQTIIKASQRLESVKEVIESANISVCSSNEYKNKLSKEIGESKNSL